MNLPNDEFLREKFLEYFNELEGYALRSERFYDSLNAFTNKEALAASMVLWLEAAFIQGAKTSKKPNFEELQLQMTHSIERNNLLISELMKEDLLDEDGYPTYAALEIIKIWDWNDAKGWFDFIQSIWHLKSWGWNEYDEPHEWSESEKYKNVMVHRYNISTAGWSGNESIIRAMQSNEMLWDLNWVESRRGGHYIFELRTFDDEVEEV